MNKVPNRYEVWVFYDPIFGHADWFHEKDCRTEEEVVDALKDVAMEFHDTMEVLDKYVEIRAFRSKHPIKSYRKTPSRLMEKFDSEWVAMFDSCMKMCENCVMNDEVEENEEDDYGRSVRLCRKGKPWFGRPDCRHYMEDSYESCLDKVTSRDCIPLIKEEMMKDCEHMEENNESD